MDVNIDDTNTTLIQYQGDWELLIGSTRQWNGTVHGTLDPNATATFEFRGYQIWVWGTIPAGVGSSLVSFSIDGGTPNVTSRTSNGSAVYNDQFYASPLLTDTYHKIVVTNKGSAADGNTEFQLDRFEFTSSESVPQFSPPGTSSGTSSAPSTTATATPSATARSSSGGSKTPIGAIVGPIVGVLVLIIAVLGYFLWRGRKRNSVIGADEEKVAARRSFLPRHPLAPNPFQLEAVATMASQSPTDPASTQSDNASAQLPPTLNREPLSEKSGYRDFHHDPIFSPSTDTSDPATPNGISSPRAMASSTSLGTTGSNSQSRTAPSVSPLLPNNDTSSSMYAPHVIPRPDTFSPLRRMSEVPSTPGEVFDQPPPSYWNDQATT